MPCTMSRTLSIAIQMRDHKALLEALKELGADCQLGVRGKHQYIHLNQSQFTQLLGLKDRRTYRGITFVIDTAKRTITVEVDDWDLDRYKAQYDKLMGRLSQVYAKCKILKDAQQKGYNVQWRRRSDGKIEMIARKKKKLATTIR